MNLPALAAGAGRVKGDYQFVLPAASTVERPWLDDKVRGSGLQLTVVEGASAALRHARAAVVASGTATVEAALAGTPMVVVYRVSALTWALGHHLLRVPYVAMPNLIAGEQVVPELIQSDFTPEKVAEKLGEILAEGPAREKMKVALAGVSARLRPVGETGTAAERAADAVLAALRSSK